MRKLLFTLLLLTLCFANGFTQDFPAVNYTTVEAGRSANLPDNTPVIQNSDAMLIWALPSNNSTSANTRAPGNAYKYQRTEYIITPTEMAAAGFSSGITLNSIGFLISAVGVGPITGTLTIYLMNTTDATYTLGTTWTTSGFTQVHNDAAFSVPISPTGVYDISLGSPFTYTGGGLYVAWEFNSPTGTAGTTGVTHYCNTTIANSLYGQRSNTSMPTTLAATNFRPATRFGTPDFTDVIAVTHIYTTEKVPVPFGTPTPLDVRVSNVSASTVSSFNLTMTVKDSATSTVRYTATLPVPDLAAGASSRISFTGCSPSTLEKVIYTASTSAIPGETFSFNNTLNLTGEVNDNLFSYSYKNTVGTGYGFVHPAEESLRRSII